VLSSSLGLDNGYLFLMGDLPRLVFLHHEVRHEKRAGIFIVPYRLGFSPQPQKNILVSHSRINPAPWKYKIYTNPAQGFLPDRLQNTPKIPVFNSAPPK